MYSHPDPGSFVASLDACVMSALSAAGHEVRHVDLHAEGFDPAFSLYERLHHTGPPEDKIEQFPYLEPHV